MERVERYTVSDFLAVCGGILGLFIGFSALSFIELIYYPFLRLYWMVWRMRKEDNEQQSNQNAKDAAPKDTSIDNENRKHLVSKGE